MATPKRSRKEVRRTTVDDQPRLGSKTIRKKHGKTVKSVGVVQILGNGMKHQSAMSHPQFGSQSPLTMVSVRATSYLHCFSTIIQTRISTDQAVKLRRCWDTVFPIMTDRLVNPELSRAEKKVELIRYRPIPPTFCHTVSHVETIDVLRATMSRYSK